MRRVEHLRHGVTGAITIARERQRPCIEPALKRQHHVQSRQQPTQECRWIEFGGVVRRPGLIDRYNLPEPSTCGRRRHGSTHRAGPDACRRLRPTRGRRRLTSVPAAQCCRSVAADADRSSVRPFASGLSRSMRWTHAHDSRDSVGVICFTSVSLRAGLGPACQGREGRDVNWQDERR